jgi:hypothetical protein
MMTSKSRQTKVLVALLFSIVLCTIILNLLGHNPPSAGAFCLSQYYSLAPIEESIHTREVRRPGYFKWIEIYYSKNDSVYRAASGLNTSQLEQSGSLSDISGRQDFDCHFIVHNGHSGIDGKIEPTENWKRQLPVIPRKNDNNRRAWKCEKTVYICILINEQNTQPTNFQIKRLYVLIKELCRELGIKSDAVLYPNSWRY